MNRFKKIFFQTKMRRIIFDHILREEYDAWNDEDRDDAHKFYNPTALKSPHNFVIEPLECVLICLDTNDLVYPFRGCCMAVHTYNAKQICVVVRNKSSENQVVVQKGTLLSTLMEEKHIENRLVHSTINDFGYCFYDDVIYEDTFE
jgi:hypothetical protein